MAKARILAPMAASCFIGTAIIVAAVNHSSASSLDEDAIKQIVTQAENAKFTLAVTGATATGIALDATHLQTAQAHASQVLNSLYTPASPLLATRLQQAQHGFDQQKSGYITALGGGIRNLAFDTVAITGTTANVHLTFTGYSRITVRQANGQLIQSTPTNDFIGDVTLIKTDQGWRISNELTRFAPGSEP